MGVFFIHFTAHTIECVCHSIRPMFGVLGLYNFAFGSKINEFERKKSEKNKKIPKT